MKRQSLYILPVLILMAALFFTFNEAKTAPGFKPAATCEQNICIVQGTSGVPGCTINVYDASHTLVATCVTGANGCCNVTLTPGLTYEVQSPCNSTGARVTFTACTANRLIITIP
jgi:hypothetical protein